MYEEENNPPETVAPAREPGNILWAVVAAAAGSSNCGAALLVQPHIPFASSQRISADYLPTACSPLSVMQVLPARATSFPASSRISHSI